MNPEPRTSERLQKIKTIPETQRYFWEALDHCFRSSDLANQEALAAKAGIGRSTISEILTRKKAGRPAVQAKIAKAFGYDLFDFLHLGKSRLSGEARTPEPPRMPDHPMIVSVGSREQRELLLEYEHHYRGIPLLESGKLAAGPSGWVFDPYEEPRSTVVVYLPELRGRTVHDLRALRVGGDSMWPVVPKGSIVVADLNDRQYIDRKIYVVNVRDENTGERFGAVKRVGRGNQGFVLISENQQYLPQITALDWPELCVGRVVWMWRSLEEA